MTPAIRQIATALADDLRQNYAHQDWNGRCYLLAKKILFDFLGQDWLDRYVNAPSGPTDFLRNDWSTPERTYLHQVRVVQLAETLLNLQVIPGIERVVTALRGAADIEPVFAELEVGKILCLAKVPFRYVEPTGVRGSDYDIEMKLGQVTACADAKSKIELTPRSRRTVLTTLNGTRDQMPSNKPGFIFVRLPQTWNETGDDDSHVQDMEELSAQFFRGTGRIVSLYFYFSLVLANVANLPILLGHQTFNPKHRFGGDEANWRIAYDHPAKTNWVWIVPLCK